MICVLLAALTLTACNGDEDEEDNMPPVVVPEVMSLYDTMRARADLTRFLEAIKESGNEKLISEEGELTVLAVDNQGMLALLDTMTAATYGIVTQRHILNKALTAEQMLKEGAELKNLLGEPVTVVRDNGGYKVSIDLGYGFYETSTIRVVDKQCTNGLMNVLSDISFTTEPEPEAVTEDFWQKKEDVMEVLNACYTKFAQFEKSQLYLEGFRINRRSVHSLSASSLTPQETYSAGYQAINTANMVTTYAPAVVGNDASFSEKEMKSLVAQATCIRAFVYYNLAMLWGDVIYYTDTSIFDTTKETPDQIAQSEVFRLVYNDIDGALNDLPAYSQWDGDTITQFIRNTGLMLKVELALTMGKYDIARSTLSGLDRDFHFGFINPTSDYEWDNNYGIIDQFSEIIPIYTPQLQDLFRKEAEGDTDGLAEEWTGIIKTSAQTGLKIASYGYWAALKRLGKAQEVTGCDDHELLMPFSVREISSNPKLRQNPGY